MGRPLSKHIIANDALIVHPFDDPNTIIRRQKGSRRYLLNGHPDSTVYRLVPTTDLSNNQMYMLAYDSDSNVYFVEKLVRHKATLIRKQQVGVPAYQFVDGQAVKWTVNGAVQGVSVNIQNDA